jgi:hypothetical protein
MTKLVILALVVLLWALFTFALAFAVQYVLAFFGLQVPLIVVVLGILVVRALMPSRSST